MEKNFLTNITSIKLSYWSHIYANFKRIIIVITNIYNANNKILKLKYIRLKNKIKYKINYFESL